MGLLCQQDDDFSSHFTNDQIMGLLNFLCCQAQHFRLLLLLPLACFPHWGRTLPGLHIPWGSKIYLVLKLQSVLVPRNLYPYPCLPTQGTAGLSGQWRTLMFTFTFWPLFSNHFLVKYCHLGKQFCQEVISGKNQIHSTPYK